MFHPRCAERGDHNWDNWRWTPADADGTEAKITPDDTYSLPSGTAGVYFYKRACQNMGCDAVQRAERLAPVGRTTIEDTKASEGQERNQ